MYRYVDEHCTLIVRKRKLDTVDRLAFHNLVVSPQTQHQLCTHRYTTQPDESTYILARVWVFVRADNLYITLILAIVC